MFCPMCIRLLIIADENSKQDNHSNLPHKADSWQTNTHIGVLLPAEKISHALTTVPHGDDSLLMILRSLLSQLCSAVTCSSISAGIYGPLEGCAPLLHSHTRGWTHLTCYQVNHSLPAVPCHGWQHIPPRTDITAVIK